MTREAEMIEQQQVSKNMVVEYMFKMTDYREGQPMHPQQLPP